VHHDHAASLPHEEGPSGPLVQEGSLIMASCHCTTIKQRRCRKASGQLGRSCGVAKSAGGRKTRRCYQKQIQDYGPAKKVRVPCKRKR
jgi:hypothetical protein